MNLRRALGITRRIIQQFLRDRRTLALIFVAPSVIILLLGYLMRTGSSTLALGLVDELGEVQAGPFGTIKPGDSIKTALEHENKFRVSLVSRQEAEQRIKAGELKGALVLSKDFLGRLLREGKVSLEIVVEGTNPSISGRVVSGVVQSLGSALAQLLPVGGAPTDNPLAIETRFLYSGPQYDLVDYFAPVLVTFFAFFFIFLLTTVSFLRERLQGTLERLMASPVSRGEIIIGYMLGFGFFALLQSTVILLLTVFALRIHYAGNLFFIYIIVVLTTVGAVNLGVLLSTFARTELQAVQFMPIVVLPQALLSGAFWPLETLPWGLRWLSYLLPLTYSNNAMRDVMIKGFGILHPDVLVNAGVLLFFALLMVVLSSLTLRRQVA